METTGQKCIEWAAGLFEGEGSLYLNAATGQWVMRIKMTDHDVVKDFFKTVDYWGHFRENKRMPSMKPHHKTVHIWELFKRDYIFELVMNFYPYMYARRQEKMREFMAWYFTK